MKEIRFLKDLPCKLTNVNKSVLNLLGGDIYYDREGNRYAFLTFENLNKSPIYFLQLAIREYSSEGKLIQDQEFLLPYLYAPKGQFVNETPIEIDQETEAVEVYVVKATFDRQNFVNDNLLPFTSEEYINKPSRAPAKKWDSKSSITFVSGTPSEARSESGEPTAEGEATPAAPREDFSSLSRGTFKEKKKFMFFIPVAAIVAVVAIALVAVISYATYFVNVANGYM